MSILIHDGTAPVVLSSIFDPDSIKLFSFMLRPDTWAPNTIYYAQKSVVIPNTFNGFYYIATSSGRSDLGEPIWPCEEGAIVEDACVNWQAIPYNLYLDNSVNIVTADWYADHQDIMISDMITQANKTEAKISNVPNNISSFQIRIHFVFDNNEEDDRSFIVPVGEL